MERTIKGNQEEILLIKESAKKYTCSRCKREENGHGLKWDGAGMKNFAGRDFTGCERRLMVNLSGVR
jgi:hypothetical protein